MVDLQSFIIYFFGKRYHHFILRRFWIMMKEFFHSVDGHMTPVNVMAFKRDPF